MVDDEDFKRLEKDVQKTREELAILEQRIREMNKKRTQRLRPDPKNDPAHERPSPR